MTAEPRTRPARDVEPAGHAVTSEPVTSVSADPALLTLSVAETSSAWPAVSRAATLTISFLAADQVDVSARFATRGVDRFAGVPWHWLVYHDRAYHALGEASAL